MRHTDGGGSAPSETFSLVERVRDNLVALQRRIAAAGGDPAQVRIVAVTKTFPVSAVRAALQAGLVDIGENYAAELVAKAGELAGGLADGAPPPCRWHLLGAVQRNKLARLAPIVDCYQGLDRLEEGEAIARRRPGASVFVEVDTSGLAGRGGVPVGEVAALVAALRRLELRVDGVMTVAPPDPVGARRAFRAVAALRGELGLEHASMGMSGDFELAVAEGSTMVRLGTALFGPRAASAAVPQ